MDVHIFTACLAQIVQTHWSKSPKKFIIPPNEAVANEYNLLAFGEAIDNEEEELVATNVNEREEMVEALQPDGENQQKNDEEQATVAIEPEIATLIEERFAIEIQGSDDSMSESSVTSTLEIVTDDEPSQNDE